MTQRTAPGLSTPSTIRTSVVVDVPIEHAFRVFTQDMTSWWPPTHHIGDAPMIAAVIEPRVGGRWYEVGNDGTDCQWGLVLAWDPPRHLALTWHLDGDFRYDPDTLRASRVDVRFSATSSGGTLVELEHSGLERHGPTWRRLQERASGGWAFILGRYLDRVQGR